MRYGMLDATQRQTLDEKVEATVGNPTRLFGSAKARELHIERSDGVYGLSVDTVIWATGYSTGIDRIEYLLDGVVLPDPPYVGRLFDHLICPRYPVLAISGALFTSSGPMSARAAADLACWHLCVRPRLSSGMLRRYVRGVDEERAALGRMKGERTAYEKGESAHHILFSPGYWRNVILVQIHLIVSGIAPWYRVLGGLFSILVWNEQRPLELGLLGELEPDVRERRSAERTSERAPMLYV